MSFNIKLPLGLKYLTAVVSIKATLKCCICFQLILSGIYHYTVHWPFNIQIMTFAKMTLDLITVQVIFFDLPVWSIFLSTDWKSTSRKLQTLALILILIKSTFCVWNNLDVLIRSTLLITTWQKSFNLKKLHFLNDWNKNIFTTFCRCEEKA